MNNAEEATKIAREAKWATLGRAIADAARAGQSHARLDQNAATMRAVEQAQADKQTQFAALARQIGDALVQDRDTGPLVRKLMDLRARELGPAIRQL